ncbi:MAG TPA: SUMF1/EgtB/PvdO family nonheme iron enzyme [Vulgatibacter sp.]
MSLGSDERAALASGLEESRASTWRMLEGLTEDDARLQVHPEFSPLSWHAGHVAWQEERWALRRAMGQAPVDPRLDSIYDSFSSAKHSRGARLPSLAEIRRYAAVVRERTLEALERWQEAREPELVERGWVFRFLANHERQHVETMGVIRLLDDRPLEGLPEALVSSAPATQGFVEVTGGRFVLGADDDPEGWDNERRAHEVELPAFRIGRQPVTNGEWLEFMEAGGYRDDRLWSAAGTAWKDAVGAEAPLHWERPKRGSFGGGAGFGALHWQRRAPSNSGGASWTRRTLAGRRPVERSHPVAHVSFFEAEAFARWAGARLPTEAEWERAASWDAAAGVKRRWPWGDDPAGAATANLALRLGDTAPCADGDRGFAGGVWEWTGDRFAAFPGFTPGPYRGYSEPWFGDGHRVLRGGCHLTHPAIARSTFRNWFVPGMRAFPSGVRLAADR